MKCKECKGDVNNENCIDLIEELYRVFFSSPRVNPSMVLALAMLARLLDVFRGLPGAIVAVTGPKLPKTEAMEAELGMETAAGANTGQVDQAKSL